MFNCLWRAEHVGYAHIDHMKTASEQSNVRIRFVAKKFTMPNPGLSWCNSLWRDGQNRFTIDFEVESLETKPQGTFAGKLWDLPFNGFNRDEFYLANVHDRA